MISTTRQPLWNKSTRARPRETKKSYEGTTLRILCYCYISSLYGRINLLNSKILSSISSILISLLILMDLRPTWDMYTGIDLPTMMNKVNLRRPNNEATALYWNFTALSTRWYSDHRNQKTSNNDPREYQEEDTDDEVDKINTRRRVVVKNR